MKTFRLIYIGVWIWNVGHSQIITTVAGSGVIGYAGDSGLAVNAKIYLPRGISFDKAGSYYVADIGNNSYAVRKIAVNDTIYTYAGTGMWGYNGDGIAATSANIMPINVAFDSKSNGIISDQTNHRIRLVNPSGVISTICGTGTPGNTGDGGLATLAEIKCSGTVLVDKYDNIYLTDFCNNNVRKIDTSGMIITIAGTGTPGFSGDGGSATMADLNGPYAIAQDFTGNFYIADQLNNRIRKIDPNGVIYTIAGTGIAGYSGDGGQAAMAELNSPSQLAIDMEGNIFFADYYNSVVRKVDTNGVITTIAGTGIQGYSGDNGLATAAQLKHAWGVALNASGDLYIADEGNHVIRKVSNVGVMSVAQTKKTAAEAYVYPNPNNGTFRCKIEGAEKEVGFELCNALGELTLKKRAILNSRNEFEVENVEPGIYVLKIFCQGRTHVNKVIVSR